MNTTAHQLTPLRTAYLTAFIIIAALSTIKQITIQYTLAQELYHRSYSNLLNEQAVHSQRILTNSLLAFTSANRQATDAQLQHDVAGLEANHAQIVTYTAFLQEIQAHILLPKPSPYATFDAAARQFITLEARTWPSMHARQVAEAPTVKAIFYSEPAHLATVEAAISLMNADTDYLIHVTQIIEAVFWTLTAATLVCEGLFVVRPTFQQLSLAEEQQQQKEEAV